LVIAGTVLCALLVVGASEATVDTEAATDSPIFVSVADTVTVSWQIRSWGSVRLRLYRSHFDGSEALVTEITAGAGLSSFEFVDVRRPLGATVYRLRIVRGDGTETTLDSLLCVGNIIAPGPAAAPPSASRLVADMFELSVLPELWSAMLSIDEGSPGDGLAPSPDPPVPRPV